MRIPLSQLMRCFDDADQARLAAIPVAEFARVLNARVSEVEHIHRHPERERFADVRIVEAVEALERREGFTRWRTVGGAAIVVDDKFGFTTGMRAAAVMAGGRVPDGTRIEPRRVGGMESDGVLISEAQLGVGKDTARPLYFAPETEITADPWLALGGAEVIFEFDLEPNRPDLFSLSGVAKDVGAIWGFPVRLPEGPALGELPALPLQIRLESPRARRYAGLSMHGVVVAPSPQWLQNAVRGFGMRALNNVVDAANLVMLELGQPLHTFDAARVLGDAIVLRMAAPGEVLTTLDGVARTLTDECLLVCDGTDAISRPVAIAGVMGDASSEVDAATTELIVESAAFDMAAVRRASRRLSLRTEASLRFEKGLPVGSVLPALQRFAGLMRELCGAQCVALSAVGEPTPGPIPVAYDRARIRERLGMDIADGEMDRLLTASGLVVDGDVAMAPEARPDLRIPQDLVEEIGRLHGYEHVNSVAPLLALRPPEPAAAVRVARASRQVLRAAGFDEVYLPVWIGAEEIERFRLDPARLIHLINPLASDLTTFRTTALPALLAACVQNRKELTQFAMFEVGRIYRRIPGVDTAGAIDERQHLAGLALGRDLLEVRDVLIQLGRALGAGVEISRPSTPDFSLSDVLHPGRSLCLGQGWATVGELHPRLVRAVGLRETPVVFWADLEQLLGVRPPAVRFTPPARHPSVVLDLNVTVPARVEAQAVLAAVPPIPGLVTADVVDVYPLADGARLTLRITWNATDRSLTAEEAAGSMLRVREALGSAGFQV